MRVVYIAGAYRDSGENGVWENIMRARTVARQLWYMGLIAICPHTNSIMMGGNDLPPEVFLEGGLEILRRCDAIFMLRNWKESIGAQKEWELAKELDIPVIYEEDANNIVELLNLKWGVRA